MTDIKKHAVRSVAVTIASQIVKFIFGLGITMILGRLLTPHDYGVLAMAGVFTGFIGVFKDGGLSIVTVQRADITDTQLSTLFWINVGLGFCVALIIVLLSPLVAWFYKDPSLTGIVMALAVPFIFGGISTQFQAILQRQLRFKVIAFIEIACLVLSAGTGVIAAINGWGVWALVVMTIVSAIANTLFVFIFCRWRPGKPVRGCGVRSMLKFGGQLTVNKFFDSIACSTDSLLLGKFFSADMLGHYTRAQSLMLLPFSQIMPALLSVFLPVMSRLAERPESLKRAFLDLLQLTAILSSFITVILFVGADWIIRVFLGAQWGETSDVLRLLSGPAFTIPLSTICVACLTALGKGNMIMRWSLFKNVIIIFAMVGGIRWGAQGVATALSIISICILMPILNSISAKAGVASLKEIWSATGPGVFTCILGCVLLYFLRDQHEIENPLVGLFVLTLINAIYHLMIISSFPSCRKSIGRLFSTILSTRTA